MHGVDEMQTVNIVWKPPRDNVSVANGPCITTYFFVKCSFFASKNVQEIKQDIGLPVLLKCVHQKKKDPGYTGKRILDN